MLVFYYEKLLDDRKKSGMTWDEIALKTDFTYDGINQAIKNQRMSIKMLLQLCEAMKKHPCDYFPKPGGDQSYIVSEPDMIEYYRKKDDDISQILEMRKEEVQFLKGEINRLREIVEEKDKQLTRLQSKK